MKKGFTLAEIMIVLTVIGVLTAILLPSAIHSIPDENVLKFKKANATFYSVISELAGSGQYFREGNLMFKPDGSEVVDVSYTCNAISDILTVKSSMCDNLPDAVEGGIYSVIDQLSAKAENGSDWLGFIKRGVDNVCRAVSPTFGKEIELQGGITIFEANPHVPFGSKCVANPTGGCDSIDNVNGTIHRFRFYTEASATVDTIDGDNNFNIFCVDIDGVPQNATKSDCVNECPFGYGVRYDGKILSGARADEWVKKSVQQDN